MSHFWSMAGLKTVHQRILIPCCFHMQATIRSHAALKIRSFRRASYLPKPNVQKFDIACSMPTRDKAVSRVTRSTAVDYQHQWPKAVWQRTWFGQTASSVILLWNWLNKLKHGTCKFTSLTQAFAHRYRSNRVLSAAPMLRLRWEEAARQSSLPNRCTTKCRPHESEQFRAQSQETDSHSGLRRYPEDTMTR